MKKKCVIPNKTNEQQKTFLDYDDLDFINDDENISASLYTNYWTL